MKVRYAERLLKSYADAPLNIRKAFDKQIRLLLANLQHPSLHAKKYDESHNVWQARINQDWRFYFTIEGATFYIVDMTRHPK